MYKILALIVSLLVLSACKSIGIYGDSKPKHPPAVKKGPPSHAPAHGHRRKFGYRYYPDQRCYYSSERGLWFWTDGKSWKVGANLPPSIRISASDGVNVMLSSNHPSSEHHSVRAEHPGKGKHHGHDKHKGKGKDKHKEKGKNKGKGKGKKK